MIATHFVHRPDGYGTLAHLFAKSLAIHVVALLSSIVMYRLSPWHPLARFPGPPLRKVSELVGAYYAAIGKKATAISELHKQYGSVVRTGMSYPFYSSSFVLIESSRLVTCRTELSLHHRSLRHVPTMERAARPMYVRPYSVRVLTDNVAV